MSPRVLLASTSPTRRAMLAAAGLAVEAVAPGVDEAPVKARLAAAATEDAAIALAEAKALAVSASHPDALVIGADQILDLDGARFDKPVDLDGARAQLLRLQGRRHRLVTAVALAEGGRVTWRHVESPLLIMRGCSPAFIESYLVAAGDDVLGSVGAYRLEGLGAQLFERVEGDYFSILGLPLLALLATLRRRGILAA